MFDVGFWELALIALVALLVFGPEQLPSIIRELSCWYRKIQTAISAAKSEIDYELQVLDKNNLLSKAKESAKREVNVNKPISQEMNHSDSIGSENKRPNTDSNDSQE
jgi:sec-independent protein translocase protein TatB